MTKKTKIRGSNGSPRKRKYARSTPLGRLIKRFRKSKESVQFSIDRMGNWTDSDGSLAPIMESAARACAALQHCIDSSEQLAASGWVQAKKSMAVVYEVGDLVQISPKYRSKYRQLYSVKIMDNLAVTKVTGGPVVVKSQVLDEGAEVVQFFVVKSHLQRRQPKGFEKEREREREKEVSLV